MQRGSHACWVTTLLVLGLASQACAQRSSPGPSAPERPAPSDSATPEPAPTAASARAAIATAPVESASAAGAAPAETPPPAQAPSLPEATPSDAAEQATSEPENPGLVTLRRYYNDLNRHQFDASRYFAAQVKVYITMKRPTARAIDHYMRNVFPKQFESYEFLLDETTLRPDGPNAVTFAERSRYYVVSSHEFRTNLAQVRVEFDPEGKIVDFRHVKVFEREKLKEAE